MDEQQQQKIITGLVIVTLIYLFILFPATQALLFAGVL